MTTALCVYGSLVAGSFLWPAWCAGLFWIEGRRPEGGGPWN